MKELRGRNAILTGASRGLGVHIARALAGKGINLALAARSADALEEVCEEVRSLDVNAVALPTDLAEAAQVAALADEAERELGSVDILVNNAGIEHTAPYEKYSLERIIAAVEVNLLAAMLLTRAVLPGMLARGRGHLVNMSSLAGKIGLPYQTPYATTKAGLVMFTHSLRAELVDKPVEASVICPGFVADAGMYARNEKTREAAPKLLMPTTTNKVVGAVLKALKENAAELIVNPLPMRPLTALREILPSITPHMHRAIGTTGFARGLAAKQPLDGRGQDKNPFYNREIYNEKRGEAMALTIDGERVHRAVSDDGTEIAGRAHGQGPPLVLVPGAMADGEFVWDSLLPLLTDHFTCYAMSTRGRGPLSGQSTDLSPERRVQDVVAFVESIGEPVGLVGWSGGGLLVLGAVEYTDAVSAVAAYEPAVFEAISEDEFARFRGVIAHMGELAGEGRLADAARAFIELVANDDEVADAAALGFFESCAPNVPVFLREVQQMNESEAASPTDPSELGKITVPTLLLHGTRSIPDPWFHDGVRHVTEHVADASVREISGAGHLGPSHEPEAVADELVRFFSEVQETA